MAADRHKLFDHSLTGVACRLLVAPLPSLLIAGGLVALPSTALDQWPGLIVGTIVRCFAFGTLLGLLTIIVGLPLYLVYRWLRWRWFVAYMLGAALVAGGLYLLPELGPRNETFGFGTATCEAVVRGARTACGWDMFWHGLWINLAYGALAGAVFWLLLAAGRSRTSKLARGQTPDA